MPSSPSRARPALAAAALSLLVPAAAHAGTYSTLASFQANVRANFITETFNGPDSQNVPSYPFSGNGFAVTLDSSNTSFGLARINNRMGSASPVEGTTFTFTGRPVSAFGADVIIINGALTPVSGNLSVVTDTGESFVVPITTAGAFVGLTTSRPFTTLTINTDPPSSSTFEFVDNAYVGISANAPEFTDQCSDAETVNPITAVQYPFTTAGTGATAEPIAGVCDGATDTGPDVWLRFVSPVYGNVTINTCGCTFDSILRVFSSCPGPSGTGQIACNDDFCLNSTGLLRSSQVSFRAEAGEDYLIRISGFAGASGSGMLTFSVVPDCRADFNHTGGAPSVQDIFDFLAAYFGGCP